MTETVKGKNFLNQKVILGLYYGIESYFDGNGFFCSRIHGRYLEMIAKRVGKILLFSPVADATYKGEYYGSKEYRIESSNIEVIPLPYFYSFLTAVRYFFNILYIFMRNIKRADIFWIRYPQPFGYVLFFFAKRKRKKVFFQLSGDVEEEIRKGKRYRGIIKVMALGIALLEKKILRNAFKHSLVFIQGNSLYRKYSFFADRAELIISSSLMPDDFNLRNDVCVNSKLKLLFVGSLNHEKNIDCLIRSCRLLINKGVDTELIIVGKGPEELTLRKVVKEEKLEGKVKFYGYVPCGEEMTRIYQEADIFILPSFSEGTPRVLLEAMAHCLPVVATRVGGIENLVTHYRNGLLIEKGQEKYIVGAVETILRDSHLRRRMIEEGYAFARRNLLKDFIGNIFEKVDEYYRNKS